MRDSARRLLTRPLDYRVGEPFLQQDASGFYLRQSGQLHNSKRRSESKKNRDERLTCSTFATRLSLSRSKIDMHSWAMLRCKENCAWVRPLEGNVVIGSITFSRCSWYCGRLASISFMSFRLAAPSLQDQE